MAKVSAIVAAVVCGGVFAAAADRIYTTPNPAADHDQALMARLGLVPMAADSLPAPKVPAARAGRR